MKTNKDIKETNNTEELNKVCCDVFKKNIHNFRWFKLEYQNDIEYVMPHILGTMYRINFCPSCGKEVRDIILSHTFYHSV